MPWPGLFLEVRMTLLAIEGFEGFGTTTGAALTGLSSKYSGTNLAEAHLEDGRYGGYAMESRGSFLTEIQVPITSTNIYIGFAWKIRSGASLVNNVNLLRVIGGIQIGALRTITGGELRYFTSGLSQTTSGLALTTDTWYYIEVNHNTHASTGSFSVRVDGVEVLSAGPGNTGGSVDSVNFGVGADGYYYDDIYILDSAGSVNNTFLGDREIVAMLPDGAGDSNDWTNSASSGGANNFGFVDETGSDGDSTYNESNTTNHLDLYDFADLASDTTINGIQVNAVRRVTTGSNTFYQPCKSGSTTSDGSSQSVSSTTYATGRRIMETDPDTAAAWTTSGLNAAQFGIKVG
jgi:hypothetical protein